MQGEGTVIGLWNAARGLGWRWAATLYVLACVLVAATTATRAISPVASGQPTPLVHLGDTLVILFPANKYVAAKKYQLYLDAIGLTGIQPEISMVGSDVRLRYA